MSGILTTCGLDEWLRILLAWVDDSRIEDLLVYMAVFRHCYRMGVPLSGPALRESKPPLWCVPHTLKVEMDDGLVVLFRYFWQSVQFLVAEATGVSDYQCD